MRSTPQPASSPAYFASWEPFVVMVSSSDRQTDVRECYELGANSFVVKQLNPWSPGTYLVDTVRYWLDINEIAS